jgi:D-tyrosyl-tRNA(Tyr) deacylase
MIQRPYECFCEIQVALLVVSQLLVRDVRRGLRPSWSDAAPPHVAEPLYDYFVVKCRVNWASGNRKLQKMMQVELVNDGPVT